MNILEYEIGNSCHDEILRIDGIDYKNLNERDILRYIEDI